MKQRVLGFALGVFVVALLGMVLVTGGHLEAQSRIQSPHGTLDTDCAECHSAEGWTPILERPAFRHDRTGFALEASHGQVGCRSCHQSLVFNQVGIACLDCHRDAHRGELGTQCEACHTPRTWSNQREMFQVHNRTRFPLFAVHAKVDCQSCHRGQRPFEYANTPTDCGTCHARTFEQTTNPSHVAAGFSRRCEDCHRLTAMDWRTSAFNHATFPLRGAHTRLLCAQCHGSGFRGTARECVGCHRADYDRTTDPNHVRSRYPLQCDSCHQESAWRPATGIDHALTAFPLTGAHERVECARCHVGNRFAGTPKDCYSCHQSDQARVQNPSHSAFPRECEACHGTSAWRPASFDHNQSRFPLTGAHRGVGCERCHGGGRYAGTPRDCNGCHADDYGRTGNPNHASSGFPRTCQDCHSTNAWRPANFNHDGAFFPINSGKHRGKWSSCGDCHVNSGNFRVFECIRCHEHSNKREVDDKHRGVSGYSYTSAACYRCHPQGRAED